MLKCATFIAAHQIFLCHDGFMENYDLSISDILKIDDMCKV